MRLIKLRSSNIFVVTSFLIWTTVSAPLLVLAKEFGRHAWPFATAYSGLFVWPVIFMPIILVFSFRPINRYIDLLRNNLTLSLEHKQIPKTACLLMPIIFPLILTPFAYYFEIANPRLAIWEASLESPYFLRPDNVSYRTEILKEFNIVPKSLIESTSWPNIFYVIRDISDYISIKKEPEENILEALSDAQQKFRVALDSNRLSDILIPSKTRFFYLTSFCVIVGFFVFQIMLMGIFLIFYLIGRNVQKNYGNLYFKRSFISFSMITICFLSWMPLRLVTYNSKTILYGQQDPAGEIVVFILLLFVVALILIRWWSEQTRAIVTIVSCIFVLFGISPVLLPELFARAVARIEFFVLFGLIYVIPSTLLWLYLNSENIDIKLSNERTRLDDD